MLTTTIYVSASILTKLLVHDNDWLMHAGLIISTGMSTQLPSFVAEPESPVSANPNTTAQFVWKIENSYCILNSDWRLKVVTKDYDLYPNLQPENVPIINITDYTAEVKCQDNNTVVVLTINFNENVLTNVEYVVCKAIRRHHNREQQMITSRVNFITIVPTTTTTTMDTSTSSSTMERTTVLGSTMATPTSKSTVETTTDSGCRQCVHLSALILCLFITNFIAFSWNS